MSREAATQPRRQQLSALVVVALLAVPILFGGPQHERVTRFVVYGLLGEAVLLVWLFRNRSSLGVVGRFFASGPGLASLAYLGWSVLGLVFSIDPVYSQVGFIQLAFGIVLFTVIACEFSDPIYQRALLGAILVLGIVPPSWAFLLNADGRWSDRAGTFHDWQLLGGFLGLLFPVICGVAVGVRSRIGKTLSRLALATTAVGLMLTHCRSAWIGAGAGMVVFGILYVRLLRATAASPQSRRDLSLTLGIVLAGCILFLVAAPGGQTIRTRVRSIATLSDDSGWNDRVELWNNALLLIQKRPLLGSGLGTYGLALAAENLGPRSELLVRETGPTLSENAHNLYLQLAAEQGFIGLCLYLSVLALCILRGLRALFVGADPVRKAALAGSVAALVGQSVDAFANPAWVYPEVSTFFWMVMGTVLALSHSTTAAEAAEATEYAVTHPRRPFTFLGRAARTAALGCVALWIGQELLEMGSRTDRATGRQDTQARTTVVPSYGADIDHLALDYLGDGLSPAATPAQASGEFTVGRPGAAARFKIWAVAAGGRAIMDVTGEGSGRLDVRVEGELASLFRGGLRGSAQLTYPFIMLPPSRGRQLHVVFRVPPTRTMTGELVATYRYGRNNRETAEARYVLTVHP